MVPFESEVVNHLSRNDSLKKIFYFDTLKQKLCKTGIFINLLRLFETSDDFERRSSNQQKQYIFDCCMLCFDSSQSSFALGLELLTNLDSKGSKISVFWKATTSKIFCWNWTFNQYLHKYEANGSILFVSTVSFIHKILSRLADSTVIFHSDEVSPEGSVIIVKKSHSKTKKASAYKKKSSKRYNLYEWVSVSWLRLVV